MIIFYHHNDYADTKFIYFLSFNENLQLRICESIDLTVFSTLFVEICWHYFLEIIREVGKLFLRASENIVFVIDLRRFKVSQILEDALPLSADGVLKW